MLSPFLSATEREREKAKDVIDHNSIESPFSRLPSVSGALLGPLCGPRAVAARDLYVCNLRRRHATAPAAAHGKPRIMSRFLFELSSPSPFTLRFLGIVLRYWCCRYRCGVCFDVCQIDLSVVRVNHFLVGFLFGVSLLRWLQFYWWWIIDYIDWEEGVKSGNF